MTLKGPDQNSAIKRSAIRDRAVALVRSQRVESGQALNSYLQNSGGVVSISGAINDGIDLSATETIAVRSSNLKGELSAEDKIILRKTSFSGSLTCDTLYILDGSVVSGCVTARVVKIDKSRIEAHITGAETVQRDALSEIQVTIAS